MRVDGYEIERLYFSTFSKKECAEYKGVYNSTNYFDVNTYDQHGTVKTYFGSEVELKVGYCNF